MKRTPPVVTVVAMLVLSTVAAVSTGAVVGGAAGTQPATNETDQGAGAIVGSGIAAEGESLDGELERNTFDTEFETASTDRRRAAVIADYHDAATDRLDTFEGRMDELEAARANGSLAQSTYESRATVLRTEAARVHRLALRLENASARVGPGALHAAGISREALHELRTQASTLAGDGTTGLASGFDRRFFGQVATITTDYNDIQPGLGVAAPFLEGNLVNLHVQRAGGTETILSFRITDDNRIEQLRAGSREGAPIRMETDRATVQEVSEADAPSEAFRQAVEDGDIDVHGNGLLSGAVWTVLNALQGLLG